MERDMNKYYETGSLDNPIAQENAFRDMRPEIGELPMFEEARALLPEPVWDGHDPELRCYWKAWELAFRNLKKPIPGSGFVAPYIGTCFNDCLFMWDSVFALFFGLYGRRAFDFQRTLDNLYARQHGDGFICREIGEADGLDRFHRHDPSSTGTHVMPWSEWAHYAATGDRERLARAFPVLVAFHRWLMAWRTWKDGSYWSSGWGSGMDNQPRFSAPIPVDFYHGHMAWVDVCMQMLFAGRTLLRMAAELGREGEVADIRDEAAFLESFVNENMWDEETGFYYDLMRDGSLSSVMTVGAYWALLAGAVPPGRMERFAAHLNDLREFNRPHRVPARAASVPGYRGDGGYWRGGVWVFTNYPVLCGLSACGFGKLAHEIALNHVGNVAGVFEKTGTIWENYAPESMAPGNPSRPDFVGAGGCTPIAVLFEHVFGIRTVEPGTLEWDVRMTERHGVRKYPIGGDGTVDLVCAARASLGEKPAVTVRADCPVGIKLTWEGGSESIAVNP
jgi:hypothetical protein